MSNLTPYQKAQGIIVSVENEFNKLAQAHNAVKYRQEMNFALQQVNSNGFLASTVSKAPDTLKNAILNVAAIGLTLNPAHARAYLVPRDGKVCLDISYKGLIYLAVSSGSIKWAQAEVVYENDEFEFLGVGAKPYHKSNPFGDRGAWLGVYVVAKTKDDEFLTTIMAKDEIFRIRDRTSGWKKHQKDGSYSIWASDEIEMSKKTVVKRAHKTWPISDNSDRLAQAISTVNEHEGIDFESEAKEVEKSKVSEIRALLKEIDRSEDSFLHYAQNLFEREIPSIEEMNESEIGHMIALLSQFSKSNEKAGSDEVA